VSAEVPETQFHLDLRTTLYLLLSDHLGEAFTVGSDQFVYWDAGNPKRCLAPDVYVKDTPRGERVRSWKTWERGAPDVAIEIVSDSDSIPSDWSAKLDDYQALGVRELVRLDLLDDTEPSLRVWDRVDGRLGERLVEEGRAASLVLDLHWVIAPLGSLPRALRLESGDPPVLVPTAHEARQAEARARQVEAQGRQAEARAREAAEAAARDAEAAAKQARARVVELEALLERAERERGQ
jgi:Uma2 family endonuclease